MEGERRGLMVVEGDAAAEPSPGRSRALRVTASVACALLLAAGGGNASLLRSRRPAAAGTAPRAAVALAAASSRTLQDSARCGLIEAHMDYEGTDVDQIPDVPSAAECCERCQENPHCRIWMWGTGRGETAFTDGGDFVCTLRAVGPFERIVKKPAYGVVSGLPFDWVRSNSLFCFGLIQLVGEERPLLDVQLQHGWGIFGCDEYQVVSNQSIRLGRGLVTTAISSDLKCAPGGEYGAHLNNDIFLMVWQKVVEEGRYKYNAWTVKADADCVFFPQRLRVAVAFHPDTYHGIYLNNCKFGLHGPLEVLSRQAVDAWGDGQERCRSHFNEVCSGDCNWGEDMFLDQCLDKVLRVQRINDWNLLSEARCDSDDWDTCATHKVAFHPFRTPDAFTDCVVKANFGSMPVIS